LPAYDVAGDVLPQLKGNPNGHTKCMRIQCCLAMLSNQTRNDCVGGEDKIDIYRNKGKKAQKFLLLFEALLRAILTKMASIHNERRPRPPTFKWVSLFFSFLSALFDVGIFL
jgi:hypothetical protein